MAEPRTGDTSRLVVREDQPLIALPVEEDGHEAVHYFTDEQVAAADDAGRSIQAALDLAGVWGDLDWDEMEAALYRMRHESPPTPPIEDL